MSFKIEENTANDTVVALFTKPGLDTGKVDWTLMRKALRRAYDVNGSVSKIEFSALAFPYTLVVTYTTGETLTYAVAPPSHSADSDGAMFRREVYAAVADLRESLVAMVRNWGLDSLEVTR